MQTYIQGTLAGGSGETTMLFTLRVNLWTTKKQKQKVLHFLENILYRYNPCQLFFFLYFVYFDAVQSWDLLLFAY